MAHHDTKFEGWVAMDKSAAEGNMVWQAYDPKPWEETDIDIEITHCGVCGTDLHQLRSGWGQTAYPVVVGHELVGITVRVGKEAAKTGVKLGDRVGVGAQNDACQCRKPPQTLKDHSDCNACSTGNEVYCPNMTLTYGAKYLTSAGGKSMGGYARYHRCPAAFAFKIPDDLASEHAAPMMCAGLTAFSPLVHFGSRYNQRPTSEKLKGLLVGVIGIGGVGHFAVLFAKALGAQRVVAFSRHADKRDDALALGADTYVATAEDRNWEVENAGSLDLILCTISSSNMPLTDYITLLKRDGSFCQLGLPDDGQFNVDAAAIASQRRSLTGSFMGSPNEIREMLQLAADKAIKPRVEVYPMSEANSVLKKMELGKAKYRYVLVNH
ncbi:hypothetical protein TGAMA5MH_08604 [Trichoderma gamsii]|uniref:Enoyl reductase (ER) domain-containing protein n=1 Tax=Trichoderma gamsii TaxID=398673 RepID=A0A2K0T229_9HYPO|nr:hypothetical protein TGAMA5MH_08604 [Trichoderma gamsii]